MIPLPTVIQRYLEATLYLLVFTGFATLASTGGLDSPTVLVVGALLILRGYLLLQRHTLIIPERWTTLLTLGYVVFYLADYFLISRAFLSATVHLVLFVMAVRLFSAQRARDHYFLAVISFLMVLSAAVLTVDSTFLLTFAVFMLIAVLTFMLMEMQHASGKATVQAKESRDESAARRMAVSLAGASPALVLFILLGASGIFFVLPRGSAGYLTAYSAGNELTTGFSDRVQLGRIGQIQQSSAVVMHIQIDNNPHGSFDLKWRGVALNNFDGTSWSSHFARQAAPQSPDGRFLLSPSTTGVPHISHRVSYRVLMEPLGTNVFFLAATPQSLQGDYRVVGIDGGGAVFDLDPSHAVNRYEATSDIAQPGVEGLRALSSSYPPDMLLDYLQLPEFDPRIPQLARQIVASADNSYDKAVAIETYLRTEFGYTLELPRTAAPDPLANFLFERRRGHCEYFASSMAVMLRTLGIPSRVVNGFRTGEFNDLTAQYVVRASDAHSWVEAYFPGYGWVSFDPTPAGSAQTRMGWSRIALYVDAMASFWREWVINYDLSHQQDLAQNAARSGRRLLDESRNWWQRHYQSLLGAARQAQNTLAVSPGRWSAGAVLTTALLVLLAHARRLQQAIRRRRLAAHPEKAPSLAASIWYERMTRTVARHGWRKSPAQTPSEFVISIGDSAVRERVEEFTQHYEGARFGDSGEDARRLPELYQEISATVRR